MGKKYTRLNGESMDAFRKRCNEAEHANMLPRTYEEIFKRALDKKPKRRKRFTQPYNPTADVVDGLNRDDLGESPDY